MHFKFVFPALPLSTENPIKFPILPQISQIHHTYLQFDEELVKIRRNSMIPGPGARGSQQMVSEPADPLFDPMFESSTRGSSGHGESGGTTTARRRASVDEDRIRSIESTVEVLSGTIFNLSNQFDKIEGRFDRFEERVDNFERKLEEFVRSRHDHEFSNPELHQTPSLNSPMAVKNSFSHIHMSTSPVNANMNQPWGGSPPVMHQTMSVPEETPEERIRLLRAIYQKYKGDSKSPEEQLQILTAASQKYKARRDSKAFEVQLKGPNIAEVGEHHLEGCLKDLQDDSIAKMITLHSGPEVRNDDAYPRNIDHDTEGKHVNPCAQASAHSEEVDLSQELPPNYSDCKQGDKLSKMLRLAEMKNVVDLLDGLALSMSVQTYENHDFSSVTALGSNSLKMMFSFTKQIAVLVTNRVTCTKQLEVPKFVQLHSNPATKKWGNENIGSATCKRGLGFWLWDPGIQISLPMTLGQGQFEGEGLMKTLGPGLTETGEDSAMTVEVVDPGARWITGQQFPSQVNQ